MSHYPKQIKRYLNTTGFTTGIGKVIYITQIKDFFKQSKIKKSYKKQILDHNIEKFSLIIRDDIDMFFFIKILIQANKKIVL